MKPTSRCIPNNATPVEHPSGLGIVYTYETESGKPFAIAYAGKANKPAWHYSFVGRNAFEQRSKRIADFLAGLDASAKLKAERKAERQKPHALKSGEILKYSWGYDQTNVEFYQVTRVSGSSVWLREIAQNSRETGFMCGQTSPVKDKFIGPEIMKRANQYGVSFDFGSGRKWNGGETYYSSYA